jgi:hypothetical protein
MLLRVYVSDGEVMSSTYWFAAVYCKPPDQPQLILRRRTETDDYELLASMWEAANQKVHELG